jgi:hypothetical protein
MTDKKNYSETTILVTREDKELFDWLFMVHGRKMCKSKKEFFGKILRYYIKENNIKSVKIEFDVD